jgi:hypothetical protein
MTIAGIESSLVLVSLSEYVVYYPIAMTTRAGIPIAYQQESNR